MNYKIRLRNAQSLHHKIWLSSANSIIYYRYPITIEIFRIVFTRWSFNHRNHISSIYCDYSQSPHYFYTILPLSYFNSDIYDSIHAMICSNAILSTIHGDYPKSPQSYTNTILWITLSDTKTFIPDSFFIRVGLKHTHSAPLGIVICDFIYETRLDPLINSIDHSPDPLP